LVRRGHIPPAKKRYDDKHPVISFRDSRGVRDRLRTILEKQNKSIGQFFREALEVEERNYNEAFWNGYRKAKERYAVYVTCYSCGEPIAIDDQEMKEEIYLSIVQICMHHDCGLIDGLRECDVRRLGRRQRSKGKKGRRRPTGLTPG
jgi:hypothetical protein